MVTARRRPRRRPTPPRFRGRLLDGMIASIGERGYRDTTVADIVRNAKTSKRTFYGEFASKEECFIELLRTNNDELIAGIRAAVDPDADWHDQIRAADSRLRRPHRVAPRHHPELDPRGARARRSAHCRCTGSAMDQPHRHARRPHRQPRLPPRRARRRSRVRSR